MTDDEQWREIPGFGENYLISNQGKVKSKKRRVPPHDRFLPERRLLIRPNGKPNGAVHLQRGGESVRIDVGVLLKEVWPELHQENEN